MSSFPGNPLVPTASALYSALHFDLKDLERESWTFIPQKGNAPPVRKSTGMKKYRPGDYDITVEMFTQMWGSTALGFGGIGGAAMTTAYTHIIRGPSGEHAVYFNGRFAYLVERPTDKFYQDVRDHNMTSVSNHHRYEKDQPNEHATV